MKALTCFVQVALVLLGLAFVPLNTQAVILRSNDVIVFQFASLAWTQVDSTPYSTPVVDLPYNGTAGDSFKWEFFEDNSLEAAFETYVMTSSAPGTNQEEIYEDSFVNKIWTDRQGVIRFTGLSGTIVLSTISIQVSDGTNVYRQIFSIPQPPVGLAVPITIYPAAELSWPSQNTNSYQIQWSSSLNTNEWFNLDSPIQGTGTTNYYLLSTRGAGKKFYRVITQTP